MNKHQYESAIFMGDKLLALTGKVSSASIEDLTDEREPQVMIRMPFFLLKYISPRVISHVPMAFLSVMIL